jgi:fimbrial chaperone protein
MRAGAAVRALALVLLTWAGAAHAGSLRVGPTLIVLDREHPVSVVRITNNNAITTAIDVRASAWQQANNEDAYSETQELIVTPPVFDLAPGETQTVRIGLNPLANRGGEVFERSFRVFVAELPDPRRSAATMQMLMRVGIPVFVAGHDAAANLAWQMTQSEAGIWRLEATNRGSAHTRVLDVDLKSAGVAIAADLKGGYVLPGATRSWTLPVDAPIPEHAELNLHVAYFAGNDQIVRLVPRVAGPRGFLADSAR